MKTKFQRLLVVPVLFGLLTGHEAFAQEDPETTGEAAGTSPWAAKAELSLVATGGNSDTTSFAFAGSLTHTFERSSVRLSAEALRSESAINERRAVGTPADFILFDRSETETTAENFEAELRAERSLESGRSWYGDVKWRQDEFAGFDSRLTVGSGIAFPIIDQDYSTWRFETGATWNREEDLDGFVEEFGGVRLALEGTRRVTENSDLELKLEINENIEETSDVRADLYTAIKVAMNERLSLKLSLDLRFDNLPALTTIAIEGDDGSPSGDSVRLALDEFDSELKASFVVEF